MALHLIPPHLTLPAQIAIILVYAYGKKINCSPAPQVGRTAERTEKRVTQIINDLVAPMLRTDIPIFGVGDTVRVGVKVVEGSKERIQVFEGVVMRRRNGGINESFTVRRIASNSIGVERTFLVNSPRIEKIEVMRRGKVRRAQLYYLRGLSGKAARIKEKREI